MKSYELFEMLNNIDDKFVDEVLPNAEELHSAQPQEIRMAKQRFPWGITAAACVAVFVAVTAVAVGLRGGIPLNPLDGDSAGDSVVNSAGDSKVQGYPAEMIYHEGNSEELYKTFTMPEYPDCEFAIDGKCVIRTDGSGEESVLIGFPGYVSDVCIGDLNGDGKREIISVGWNGLSGLAAQYIQVYDLENSKRYILDAYRYCHSFGDCDIDIIDGAVYAVIYEFGKTPADEDGIIEDIRPLTTDIMVEVIEGYNPQAEVVLNENVRTDYFTMSEYPDYEFIIENGDITAKNIQTGETEQLFNSSEITKICLEDMNCNYKREIVAIVKRKGEENTVWCYAYMDYDNNLIVHYGEPLEEGYDMDMEIIDGRFSITDSSPIDMGFSEYNENDILGLTVSSTSVNHATMQLISLHITLENKTNDEIYLYSPEPSDTINKFVRTSISRNGKALSPAEDLIGTWISDEVNYYPILPGETVDVYKVFNPADAESGIYDGICSVIATDKPYDDSPKETLDVEFQIMITE